MLHRYFSDNISLVVVVVSSVIALKNFFSFSPFAINRYCKETILEKNFQNSTLC